MAHPALSRSVADRRRRRRHVVLELDAAGRRGCDAPATSQGRSAARIAALRRRRQSLRRSPRRTARRSVSPIWTGARPTFLLAPGIAASVDARSALAHRPLRQGSIGWSSRGHAGARRHRRALEPSSLLQSSGNIFSEPEHGINRRFLLASR